MIAIYDTLTKSKRTFEPMNAGKVGLYVCGMTVYDYCHLGHARVMVCFDVITRYLRHRGFEVNYIRNITDVDDKIINRAAENGEPWQALTERYIAYMNEDAQALGVLPPNAQPKATETIAGMLEFIQVLLDKEYAYVAENGDVCFAIKKFEDYGKLSKKDLSKLRVGARVEAVSEKQDPLDFVLWKRVKPGEPSWPSPWGEGRPGWHIECSAMSRHHLGETFDIHGGGPDLVFPHHENEIAQSEAAHDKPFARNWMHVGALRVDKEKMSKSLGNFFTIRDVLKVHHPEVIRYFLLSSQYRSPIDYSHDNLHSAKSALERFYLTLRDSLDESATMSEAGEYETRFHDAMDDDFHTPQALAALFDLAREINRLHQAGEREQAAGLAKRLKYLGAIIGILQHDPHHFLHGKEADDPALVAKIEGLIAERNTARAEKDWARADAVRDALDSMGVQLEDGAEGTQWRIEQK